MIIKIQSITDLITNSSTEVYLCTASGGIDIIVSIIDSILKAAGSTLSASDMFDIEDSCGRYEVKAKSDKYIEAAYWLDQLNDIFYADGEYNG